MNYYSEQDIRDIVTGVLTQAGAGRPAAKPCGDPIPVEISARHVHLTQEAVEKLFGKGYQLTKKRELSQPGEFLSGERVKLVSKNGQIENVAVLGPVRSQVQVELSQTDSRTLGIRLPVCLSGDLEGGADMLLVGPAGILEARECAIIAQAHVHMTLEDARKYSVRDGEIVSIRLETERPLTLDGVIVRARPASQLAVHIDFDEANAALVTAQTKGILIKRGVTG